MERLSKHPEFEVQADDFDFIIRTAVCVDQHLERLHGKPLPLVVTIVVNS